MPNLDIYYYKCNYIGQRNFIDRCNSFLTTLDITFDERNDYRSISRVLLIQLLNQIYKLPLSVICFDYTSTGKPYLSDNSAGIFFSISHKKDVFVIAISTQYEIGVDVEYIAKRPKLLRIAQRFFTTREIHNITSKVSIDCKLDTFFDLWILKESYLKACGAGFQFGVEKVEVYSSGLKQYGFKVGETDNTQYSGKLFEKIYSEYKFGIVFPGKLTPKFKTFELLDQDLSLNNLAIQETNLMRV
ncbi:4'-phosphopantetheinyl transferase family protein [Pseudoalteromonas sp. XMcav1-K]|uniref:4'-phosphopantetheinyl transferase family protein n=1 Tax=Pseudoalteromonas sp. XMcav1-K TaxID=3374372 RepID=UPI003756410F